MYVLETDAVSKHFGGVHAAADISLRLGEWEIVGVIGPNGAGKTTLFNIISGFVEPDAGRVLLRRRDITGLPVYQRARLGIARTFQNLGLIRELSLRENVLTGLHLQARYGPIAGILGAPISRQEERELGRLADQLLELFDLRQFADVELRTLPYGIQKLAEVAVVLGGDPEVLLLDEPSSGMAPSEASRFGAALRRLREELRISVIMIEHHVPLVATVCDYVYCLNFGELLSEGSAEDVRADPRVVEAYMGASAQEANHGAT